LVAPLSFYKAAGCNVKVLMIFAVLLRCYTQIPDG
jgi:hypothetical protein